MKESLNLVFDSQTECEMQIVQCRKLCKKPEFRNPKSCEYRHMASNWTRKQLAPGSVSTLTIYVNEASQLGLIRTRLNDLNAL